MRGRALHISAARDATTLELVWHLAAAHESYDNDIPKAETGRRFGIEPTDVRGFASLRAAAIGAAPSPSS